MSIHAISTLAVGAARSALPSHGFVPHPPREPVPRPGESFAWADLWSELTAGRYFLSATHYLDDQCVATLHRCSSPPPCPRALLILQRVLFGEPLKLPADDLGISLVQISTLCSSALGAFSSERRASRAPIVIVMAAHAGRGLELRPARVEEPLQSSRLVLSFEMPGTCWRRDLTPCEWEVVRLALIGKPAHEIASVRGTSARTTANQLASAFRKLKLSGRIALRAKAVVATAQATEAMRSG